MERPNADTQEPLQFFRLLKVALKRAYSLVNDPDANFLVYNDRDYTQEIGEKDDFSSAHWGFPHSIAQPDDYEQILIVVAWLKQIMEQATDRDQFVRFVVFLNEAVDRLGECLDNDLIGLKEDFAMAILAVDDAIDAIEDE